MQEFEKSLIGDRPNFEGMPLRNCEILKFLLRAAAKLSDQSVLPIASCQFGENAERFSGTIWPSVLTPTRTLNKELLEICAC
jgi:hypothetical protein